MGKSGSKFLPRALRLITDEGDVETRGDNKIAHGCLFIPPPTSPFRITSVTSWCTTRESLILPPFKPTLTDIEPPAKTHLHPVDACDLPTVSGWTVTPKEKD